MDKLLDILSSITIADLLIIFGASYLIATLSRGFLSKFGSFKRIKKEIKELEENKCKGAHNWIEMNILGNKTHVCRDCYWSSKHEGFVKKVFVDAELKHMEFEEKLKKYQEEVLQSVCEEYEIEKDDMDKIYKKIISIRKDFTIKHLEESLKDILGEDSDRV